MRDLLLKEWEAGTGGMRWTDVFIKGTATAVCSVDKEDEDEEQAIACFVAEAPNMFKAIVEILNHIEKFPKRLQREILLDGFDGFRVAEEVLAKARGELTK